MSSLNLTPNELKALEQTRTRLHHLSSTLGKLKVDLQRSNPLPNPSSLQASIFILQRNLSSLLELHNTHDALFQRVAVHPSTNFPGRQHEHILASLIRKKLEPEIDDAVAAARARSAAAGLTPADNFVRPPRQRYIDDEEERGYDGDDQEDEFEDVNEPTGVEDGTGLGDVWADAGRWLNERIVKFVTEEATDTYTEEERELGVENVRTGLKRDLDESDEEEEEEDEVMGGPAAPPAPEPQKPKGFDPEHLMWLGAKGDLRAPRNLEIETVKRAEDAKKR